MNGVARPQRPFDVLPLNHIFGRQRSADDTDPAEQQLLQTGVPRVDVPAGEVPWQITMFAAHDTSLQTFVSPDGSCTYVWGILAHPTVATSDIAAWAARVHASGEWHRFRELLGTFVIIIDEPRRRTVTFVNDVLGIRPLFVGHRAGRLVFGSDVWTMHRMGFTSGEIDYRALTGWIAFSCSCTGGTLFADLRRLAPGTVTVFDDGRLSERPYASFSAAARIPETEEAADVIHHIVSVTAQALFASHPSVTLALSGGFDSRYLLALALRGHVNIARLITVSYPSEEGEVARRVADVLGVTLEDLRTGDSEWDTYEEPYHFSADGFLISKHLTFRIAQTAPGVPLVNGFLGGIVVRGHDDTLDGKYESEWGSELVAALQRAYLLTSFDMFRKDIARRVDDGSRSLLQEVVQEGRQRIGKGVEWFNLYSRQRFYISNNFLQHLSVSEALLPFYSWDLLEYKVSLPYRVFNDDVYLAIFRKQFPPLADIIHSDYLKRERRRGDRPGSRLDRWMSFRRKRSSKISARWARELLPIMHKGDWLSLLSRRRATLLIMAALAGHPVAESAIFIIKRLYLLEQRIRGEGLAFDWQRL
jgi:hypothetical protein